MWTGDRPRMGRRVSNTVLDVRRYGIAVNSDAFLASGLFAGRLDSV
jgi:hypothetical protein